MTSIASDSRPRTPEKAAADSNEEESGELEEGKKLPPVLVFDLGSELCKVGFAGDPFPLLIFPTRFMYNGVEVWAFFFIFSLARSSCWVSSSLVCQLRPNFSTGYISGLSFDDWLAVLEDFLRSLFFEYGNPSFFISLTHDPFFLGRVPCA